MHYFLQGAPCKLYFDLEFKKKLNPNVNSSELMHKFKAHLVKDLVESFDLIVDDSDILDFDSSTEEKFSRHLIINLVFKNNVHVGNYVRSFCSKFEEQNANVMVILSDKEGDVGLFVDHGVYTKNRNFRLFLSSKFGKNSILKFEPSNNCVELSDKSDKEIFLSSLITFCPNNSQKKLLTFGEDLSIAR